MIDPPYTRFTRVKNTCPSDEGHINPVKRKRGGPDESPLDLMSGIQQYQAPLRKKKDLGSLIQPRRGGGGRNYCSSLPKPNSRVAKKS